MAFNWQNFAQSLLKVEEDVVSLFVPASDQSLAAIIIAGESAALQIANEIATGIKAAKSASASASVNASASVTNTTSTVSK
jgi:hypothetical protein